MKRGCNNNKFLNSVRLYRSRCRADLSKFHCFGELFSTLYHFYLKITLSEERFKQSMANEIVRKFHHHNLFRTMRLIKMLLQFLSFSLLSLLFAESGPRVCDFSALTYNFRPLLFLSHQRQKSIQESFSNF